MRNTQFAKPILNPPPSSFLRESADAEIELLVSEL